MTRFLKLVCVALLVTSCTGDPYADLRQPEGGEAPVPTKPWIDSAVAVPLVILGAIAAIAVKAIVRR